MQKTLIFVGLAPDESSNHLIKRVIGVAGDHVTCCDAKNRVTVNDVALDEGGYLYSDSRHRCPGGPVVGRVRRGRAAGHGVRHG